MSATTVVKFTGRVCDWPRRDRARGYVLTKDNVARLAGQFVRIEIAPTDIGNHTCGLMWRIPASEVVRLGGYDTAALVCAHEIDVD